MHRNAIRSIAALAGYAAISCLPVGWTSASAAELLKARLAQNLGPISALTIVAKSKGIFEQHGLDITVSNFTSGKQCLDTVIGGGADIATTAEAPVTASAMANQPIAFVAGMEYSDLKTVAAAKAGIKGKADLRGKKIGFTAGTGSEVYTATLLKSAGLTPGDVTLVNLRPQEMLPALAALDANPAIVGKFIAALIDAETWLKAHPDDAISTVAEAVGMKRDELQGIWPDYVYRVRLDDRLIEILNVHAAWRLASGNHPPGAVMPDFSKVIAPETLKNLDPARVTLSSK